MKKALLIWAIFFVACNGQPWPDCYQAPDASTDTGTDTDTDTNTGTDEDTGAETDTDTGTGVDQCAPPLGWLDTDTGLCWSNPPAGEAFNFTDAPAHCSELDQGGFSDWRLPSIQELISLLRGCAEGISTGDLSESSCAITDPDCLEHDCLSASCVPCENLEGPDGDPSGCYWDPALNGSCGFTDLYWSSSQVPELPTFPDFGWTVRFSDGRIDALETTSFFNVRCVRSISD